MARKQKGPRVRAAKPGDRKLFRKLWLEYLTEAYESKELAYKPSERTLDRYSTFFDLYVGGDIDGEVFLIGEAAVGLVGEMALIFDEDCERKAVCWGIYVRPAFRRKGYFKLMVEEGKKFLKELKFDCVVSGEIKAGSVGESATKSVGLEPRSMSYVTWLK